MSDIEAPEDRRMDPSRPWLRPPHWGQVPPFPRPPMPAPPGPWPAGLFRLEQCWDEIAEWERFLLRMMEDLLQRNPNLISNALPTIGVTDGSAAQPGQVGEFIELGQAVPYGTAAQSQVVSLGVLPPGDWDYWLYAIPTTAVSGLQFQLDPLPAGFSTNAFTVTEFATGSNIQAATLASTIGVARTAAPSLVALSVVTNQWTAGPSAGEVSVFFMARRRR